MQLSTGSTKGKTILTKQLSYLLNHPEGNSLTKEGPCSGSAKRVTIEPIIGHVKYDFWMVRNNIKDIIGDDD